MKGLYLTSCCSISEYAVLKNGEEVLQFTNELSTEKLKSAYSSLGLNYPKYFKMDPLCKLGILGAEMLLTENIKDQFEDDEIAIILANRTSSIESDMAHQVNYSRGAASPAIFVYTLPNIAIGEISIRHKIYGESNFYIFEKFDARKLLEQAELLFATTSSRICLLGWVEYYKGNFEAVFYLLQKEGTLKADSDQLNKIKNLN